MKQANRSILDYIDHLNEISQMIQKENTGSREEMAEHLHVSSRTVTNYILALKKLGAEIEFNYIRRTYYYANNFRLQIDISIQTH